MDPLISLHDRLERAIATLDLPSEPRDLYQPISYTLSNGGKRMRPLLVLMACRIFNETVEQAVRPALAMELFHNFTLLHDDIMDDAPIRRGMPSVHKKWNSNIAILSGDAMLIKAYEQLVDMPDGVLRNVLKDFNRTAIEVCEGQQLDMDFEARNDVSIQEYLEMIRLKTAVFLAACLKIGATIGGADEHQAGLLYDFGLNAGIAFQLQDDILDVYGESNKVGKQKGGDIISNKKTFLLLKALELAKGTDATSLSEWMRCTNDVEKVEAVTRIYDRLGVRRLAEERMKEFYDKGIATLGQVQGNAEWIGILQAFTHKLMHRES